MHDMIDVIRYGIMDQSVCRDLNMNSPANFHSLYKEVEEYKEAAAQFAKYYDFGVCLDAGAIGIRLLQKLYRFG